MANRDRTTIVSVRTLAVLNAQQHVDQVQNMTQEDRIEYVTSILKTQVGFASGVLLETLLCPIHIFVSKSKTHLRLSEICGSKR